MEFVLEENNDPFIKVMGVGGCGCNAVDYMNRIGITGVELIAVNTDKQSLDANSCNKKVQLGNQLVKGLGTGQNPEIGKNAAIESEDDLKKMFGKNTRMIFIAAGMGKGTGTGAGPEIARIAKDLNILTIAVITTPMKIEGAKRINNAKLGMENFSKTVDSIIIIENDLLASEYGDLPMDQACAKADDILAYAVKGIAEIITVPGQINLDFNDVKTVMKDSGKSIIGVGTGEGDNRAISAVKSALESPLIADQSIYGAKDILVNITTPKETAVTPNEFIQIQEYLKEKVGEGMNLSLGICYGAPPKGDLSLTIIATGFGDNEDLVSGSHMLSSIKEDQNTNGNPAQTKNDKLLNGNIANNGDNKGSLEKQQIEGVPEAVKTSYAPDLVFQSNIIKQVKDPAYKKLGYQLFKQKKASDREASNIVVTKDKEGNVIFEKNGYFDQID